MLNSHSLRSQYKEKRRLLGIPVEPEGPIEPLDPAPIDRDKVFSAWMVIGSIVLGVFLLVTNCKPANAAEINDADAVKAIIGEAEDQGAKGLLALACGIRNRGSLQGVYGLNAPRVKQNKYSEKVKVQAINAWIASESVENCIFLKGAKHWESTDFDKPKWAKSMKVTFKHKKHVFYKEAA